MKNYQLIIRTWGSSERRTIFMEGEAIVEVLMQAQREHEHGGNFEVIGIEEL